MSDNKPKIPTEPQELKKPTEKVPTNRDPVTGDYTGDQGYYHE